ncbi:Purine nucleoside permease [Cladobotryum mycophilum]|uniref:Purine nucleoside permease n=1 Tax=Cladobotryum mycophilum TaxID=491253 RepID=A0ABR0SRK3_9HYPO
MLSLRKLLLSGFVSSASWNTQELKPKVVFIGFFGDEGRSIVHNGFTVKEQPKLFDFTQNNVTILGLSPQFPDIKCTPNGDVCVLVTGEGMSNALSSVMALVTAPNLDLRQTYFVAGGIAGGNPKRCGLGSVTFPRFSVQHSMQYEIDAREKPENFTTGYFPQGAINGDQPWGYVYNTEVMALNDKLQQIAADMVPEHELTDCKGCDEYRGKYTGDVYSASQGHPKVLRHDVVTSDTWFTGELLADAFDNRTLTWTNGTGRYCATAQEDGAVMTGILRATLMGKVDYKRLIIFRSISDVDRPHPGQAVLDNLFNPLPTYDSALQNVWVAAKHVITGIIGQWDEKFRSGIEPDKYVGDLWGSLGGTPDFGPGVESGGKPVSIPNQLRKRSNRSDLVPVAL